MPGKSNPSRVEATEVVENIISSDNSNFSKSQDLSNLNLSKSGLVENAESLKKELNDFQISTAIKNCIRNQDLDGKDVKDLVIKFYGSSDLDEKKVESTANNISKMQNIFQTFAKKATTKPEQVKYLILEFCQNPLTNHEVTNILKSLAQNENSTEEDVDEIIGELPQDFLTQEKILHIKTGGKGELPESSPSLTLHEPTYYPVPSQRQQLIVPEWRLGGGAF